MTKSAALTKPATPLEAALAELARRRTEYDADKSRCGAAADEDLSARGHHLRRRYEARRALIRQAETAVNRLKLANALPEVKAATQAAIATVEAEVATCREAAQHETGALEAIAARVAAMAGQIAQLEAGRFAGLEAAQGALTQCTVAGDDTGAAAAAQQVAAIESEAVVIDTRLRPLRLQLGAVAELKAAAEQRLAQAAEQEKAALQRLGRAKTEALAILADEAAIALRDALIAFGAASGKGLGRVEFVIGTSQRLAAALPGGAPLAVGGFALQAEMLAERPVDEGIFAIDPLTLEDAETYQAKCRAEDDARRREREQPAFIG